MKNLGRYCRPMLLLLLLACYQSALEQDFASGWVSRLLELPSPSSTWEMQIEGGDGQFIPILVTGDTPVLPEQFSGDAQWATKAATKKIKNLSGSAGLS